VVSPAATDKLESMAGQGRLTLKKRAYRSSDLEGMFMVFGATDREPLNRQINRDAESRNLMCNIADRPDVCNFILPATVKRGDLVIAISTSGASPAFAKKLRLDLEKQFGEEYATFLKLMDGIRSRLLKEKHAPEEHKPVFNQIIRSGIVDHLREGKKEAIDRLLQDILGDGFTVDNLMGIDHE